MEKTNIVRNNRKLHTSSAYLVKALIDFASVRGADTEAILESIDPAGDILNKEENRIPISFLENLWSSIEETLQDKFLGLHFGEVFGVQGEGHFLFVLMKNCESLEKGLLSLIRYHNLMTDLILPKLTNEGNYAVIQWVSRAGMTRHGSESVAALFAVVLKKIAGDDIKFKEVHFLHDEPDDFSEYERIFSLRPQFRSDSNKIIFDSAILSISFPLAHREFESYLRHYADILEDRLADTASYKERLSFLIKKNILKGEDSSLTGIAEIFGMSQRHLQNKLKEEGCTYQQLLDNERKGIAEHLIKQDDVLFCDIAFMLGFSEQSSFSHAFKKWTGLSPKEYREKG